MFSIISKLGCDAHMNTYLALYEISMLLTCNVRLYSCYHVSERQRSSETMRFWSSFPNKKKFALF
jgi:hypothetical protein